MSQVQPASDDALTRAARGSRAASAHFALTDALVATIDGGESTTDTARRRAHCWLVENITKMILKSYHEHLNKLK